MPKQPPKKPKQPPQQQGDEPAVAMGEVMDALAQVSARMGAEGDEVRQRVGEVREHVVALVDKLERGAGSEDAARKAAAAELERLREAMGRTQRAAGKLGGQHVQIEGLDDGLRRFADWLANPTPEKEVEVRRVVEQLQQQLGALAAPDQEAEDERRRAEIRAGVQRSLDEIFRPGKKPE